MLKDVIYANTPGLTRRNIMVGALATAAGGLAAGCTARNADATTAMSTPRGQGLGSGRNRSLTLPLRLDQPQTNLLAFVRLTGDVTGKPVYSWSGGQVFGTQEGELSQLLFHYQSLSMAEYKPLSDGSWARVFRGLILMTDPESGEVIDRFTNPYTNQENKIIHFRTAFNGAVFTTHGSRALEEVDIRTPHPKGAPFIMPWSVVGDDAWATYDERVAYRRHDGAWRVDNAVYRYRASVKELTDPEVTAPHHDWMWSTELNWFTYMNMGDIPGHLMWAGMGRKFLSLDELPADLVAEAERRYPGHLTTRAKWDELELPS